MLAYDSLVSIHKAYPEFSTIGVYDIVELGCIDDGLSEVSAFNCKIYGSVHP